jgi:hypothetical protein
MKRKIAFALLMGILTTGLISFTLIGINLGFTEKFLATWFRSWLTGYVVVIPAILILGPRVQALVDYLFREKTFVQKGDQ